MDVNHWHSNLFYTRTSAALADSNKKYLLHVKAYVKFSKRVRP